MQWYEFDNTEGTKKPRWMRSIGISKEGRIFAPAAIGGSEKSISLSALYDGTPVANYLNHIFVPIDWLSKEFPETKELCEIISISMKKTN